MRLSSCLSRRAGVSVVLACLAAQASAYFQVTSPLTGTQWVNGQTQVITWTKGVGDGITGFDVELARLGDDGLIFVARDVPCTKNSPSTFNIHPIDIPPADDYFILFLNSTPGTVFATSDRFTILPSGSTPSSTPSTSPDSTIATVTISGSPDPTKAFVTTFPASNGGARQLLGWTGNGLAGMGVVVMGVVGGGIWTLW